MSLNGVAEKLTSILNVKASVGSQSLGNNKKSIGEGGNTPLGLTLDRLAKGVALKVRSAGNLEGTSSRNNGLVDNHVVNTSQTISNGVSHLSDGVCVGSLDHKSNGLGVLNLLNKGELLLAKCLLVDETSPTQNLLRQVIDTVLSSTTADKLESLHVSSLGSSESKNVVLGEDVKRQGVNTLLVDDHKVLCAVVTAKFLLELNNLLEFGIDETTLALDKLITLLSARVEEARVNLGLLILQTDVEGEDVTVFKSLRHIGVTSTVVEGQSTNQPSVGGCSVLHLHNLHHVQIGLRGCLVDGKNGIDNVGSEVSGQSRVEFGGERCSGDAEEEFSVNLLGELETVEELQK